MRRRCCLSMHCKILPFGSRIHDKNFGTIELYILWLPNLNEESFENINNN